MCVTTWETISSGMSTLRLVISSCMVIRYVVCSATIFII